ncbi:MAG TPA: diguanylate cyclase [Gaiellaceae bacterium]|nr:diguanylate cyclase [Gaiellaceae bacterium]
MADIGDSTTWAAAGAGAVTVLVVLAVVVLWSRWRRGAAHRLEQGRRSTDQTDSIVTELMESLEQARLESDRARDDGEAARREGQRLRRLGKMSASLDFDDVLHSALETAAKQTKSDAAMILLEHGDAPPIVETYGLSSAEASQQLIALPPDVSEARAVTIRFRYTEEEVANDEFRITGGIAVPLFDGDEIRTGTLAIYWRRTEREARPEEVDLLEELVTSFGPPIDNARRYQEARRLADLDPVTGLQNERYFDDRLMREVSRARRYERQLALLLFQLEVEDIGTSLLTTVGRCILAAVRSADVSCHLGNGRFAIILPEVGVREAEHLLERLGFSLGPHVEDGGSQPHLISGLLELLPEDNAETFARRARETLRQAEQVEARPTERASSSG